MARRAKMAGKGKAKGKKFEPTSLDRVIKTRSMDVMLGIQELEIDEAEKPMEQTAQDVSSGRKVSPLIIRSNIVRNLENSFEKSHKCLEEILSSKKKIKIEFEDIAEEVSYWQPPLVCYVIGANPPKSILEGFVRRLER
uniref:Uncharacterized protein n=1 Tax=Cannabis sativa TaxID=3483 RepID=A0A803PYE7_CANSA